MSDATPNTGNIDGDAGGIHVDPSGPAEGKSEQEEGNAALTAFVLRNEAQGGTDLSKDSVPTTNDGEAEAEAMAAAAALDEAERTGQNTPEAETKPDAEAKPEGEATKEEEAPPEIDAATAALLAKPLTELTADEIALLPIELTPRGTEKAESVSLGALKNSWLNAREQEAALTEMGAQENSQVEALVAFNKADHPEINLLDSKAAIATQDLGASGTEAAAIKAEISGLQDSLAEVVALASEDGSPITASELIQQQNKIQGGIAAEVEKLRAVNATIEEKYTTQQTLQSQSQLARIDGSFKAAYPKSVEIHSIEKRGKLVESMVDDTARLYGLTDALANDIAQAALLNPAIFSMVRVANMGAKTKFAGGESVAAKTTAAKKAAAPLRIGGSTGAKRAGGSRAETQSDIERKLLSGAAEADEKNRH